MWILIYYNETFNCHDRFRSELEGISCFLGACINSNTYCNTVWLQIHYCSMIQNTINDRIWFRTAGADAMCCSVPFIMHIHVSTHWWTTVIDSVMLVQTHHVVRRLHKWVYTLQHIDELSWLVENCRCKRVTCVQQSHHSATAWKWICLNNESSV